MRLENTKVKKVYEEFENFDNLPTPEEMGVPADAERILPCWAKVKVAGKDEFTYHFGYTYE